MKPIYGITGLKDDFLYPLLALAILFGVFLRFYDLGSSYFWYDDEFIFAVGATKLHHGSAYDPRMFNYEHPPVSKWFMGLPTRFIKADYQPAVDLPINMHVWQYTAYELPYVAFRTMSAIFGTLVVLILFLIGTELYGVRAGLWSASIAALSIDFVTESRHIYPNMFMSFFILATIYAYIKYLRSPHKLRRLALMVVTFFLFVLALGSRPAEQPIWLIPILLISHFIIVKERKENILFAYLILTGVYIHFNYVYPADIRALALSIWNIRSPSDLLGFSLPGMTAFIPFRHSYLFAFAVLLIAYEAFKFLKEPQGLKERIAAKIREKPLTSEQLVSMFGMDKNELVGILNEMGCKQKRKGGKNFWHANRAIELNPANSLNTVKNYLKKPDAKLVIAVWFIIVYIGMGFTSLVGHAWGSHYIYIIYLALFVLAGKPLTTASENNKLKFFLLFLLGLNVYYAAVLFSDDYYTYSNFGAPNKFRGGPGGQNYLDSSVDRTFSYLKSQGSPPIIANDENILVFYGGKKSPLPTPISKTCSHEFMEELKKSHAYIVYMERAGKETGRYICPLLGELKIQHLTTILNPESPEDHRFKFEVFKILDS